jgi:diguanylate cyclase (GGDEF)-like protein
VTSGTGTRVGGPSRPEGLRRFLTLLIPVAFVLAGLHLAAFVAFGSVPNAAVSIAFLAYGALLSVSSIVLKRGAFRVALTVVSGGALVLAFVSPLVVPEAAAAALVVPTLVVAIALPYIERERLAGLATLCWAATVFVAVVIELTPAATPTPIAFRSVLMIGQVAAVAALVMFLLVESSGRLRRAVEQMSGANIALQEAQDTVRRVNRELRRRITELERRNREATLVSQMASLLQVSETADEAYAVVGRAGRMLFPGTIGALLVVPESRLVVEVATAWGDAELSRKVFEPQDCWALRGGRVHRVDDPSTDPVCPHVSDPEQGEYVCIPLTALGTTLGVLHIQAHADNTETADVEGSEVDTRVSNRHGRLVAARLDDDVRDLALRVSEHLALAMANFRLRETLQVQSTRDALTGLFNRRYMEESLERELHRAAREEQSLALLLLDLDNFKRFNDRLGHAAGDTLLRSLGEFLLAQVRREDVPCRYGGEEFVVIMPKASKQDAYRRAERLREEARDQWQPYGPGVTVSIGIAAYPEDGTTTRALLDAADAALYRAKSEGRDRVVAAGAA